MTEPKHRAQGYRPDIDGLRAWAVMFVVIYHAGFDILSGGFVGVDVFFVISGFLITKIIAAEAALGEFSIWRFYERRIRRIMPALTTVVIVVMIFGAIFVLPESLERMSGTALATMLFVANIHFWRQATNYFAPGAETDPFLHTWSLAVEEQFYLVFPPLFVLLFALLSRRSLILTMIACGLASFALTVVVVGIAPTATFFLPVTRIWEMLVGGLLALGAVPQVRRTGWADIGVLSGLALLLLAGFGIDTSMRFPGWVALAPVLGSAMLIHFGATSGRVSDLFLRAEPIRRVGLISYSLYLWHWPIFVLTEHYLLEREPSSPESLGLVVLTFVAATLSFRFVEEPFRRNPALRAPRRLLIAVAPLALLAVILPIAGIKTGGLSQRYPEFSRIVEDREVQRRSDDLARKMAISNCFENKISGRRVFGCELTPQTTNTAMIWGDSFAFHYLAAVTEQSVDLGDRGLISFVTLQCPPVLGYDPVNLPACKDANDRALEVVQERGVDTVFLSASWYSYTLVNRISVRDIATTVQRLQGMDVKVVLIGQSPIFSYTSPEEALLRARQRGGPEVPGLTLNRVPADFNDQLREVVQPDLFFNPVARLCQQNTCPFYDPEGYLFWDYGHLSLVGARRVVVPLLQEALRKLWNGP